MEIYLANSKYISNELMAMLIKRCCRHHESEYSPIKIKAVGSITFEQ